MTKKLILLLMGISTSLVYADVTPSVSQNVQSIIVESQQKDQAQKTDITEGLLNSVNLPLTKGQLQADNKQSFRLYNSREDSAKGESAIEVLPDLFNRSTGQERFGIRGDVIKSVDLREKGDIDGANIQFIFRK